MWNLTFDRVHRVGLLTRGKSRPIVAKFHYYKNLSEKKSFDLADTLKAANIGIGAQWPKQMREIRKPLHSVMIQERQKGNTVKLVKDELYINGPLYREKPAAANTGP